ncbi:MAG: hypothetical protein II789_00015, partial [Clostridia bacterium]|nr:hypothetical protein [Clostridia bacterium]
MGQNRNHPVSALIFEKEKSPKTAVLSHSWGFVWLREKGLEPTVLHFLCGENAAVGSAALTAHRAVIH